MDETLRGLLEYSFACSSSAVVEIEALDIGGHQAEEEGCDLFDETSSLDDGPMSL